MLGADLNRLHSSAQLLNDSYDMTPVPAPSAFVGPSRHAPPSFSDLLRQRWNAAISGTVRSVQETDYAALGLAAVDGSRQLLQQVSPPTSAAAAASSSGSIFGNPSIPAKGTPDDFVRDLTADARAATHEAGRLFRQAGHEIRKDARDLGEQIREAGEAFQQNFEKAKQVAEDQHDAATIDRGSVRRETYVGGSPEEVKAKRKVESVGSRLV